MKRLLWLLLAVGMLLILTVGVEAYRGGFNGHWNHNHYFHHGGHPGCIPPPGRF